MALQCQDRKLLCQVFAQAIYLLNKTNQWNSKFWPSCLLEGNSPNFFGGAELEIRREFPPKFSMAFWCQDRKLLCQFFAQAIYLLDKTNQCSLKFWPSCLLEDISPSFIRLNWKPRFTFCWNFFFIGIYSIQDWKATTRHRVTRKRNTKGSRHTGNLFRKNLQSKDVC